MLILGWRQRDANSSHYLPFCLAYFTSAAAVISSLVIVAKVTHAHVHVFYMCARHRHARTP